MPQVTRLRVAAAAIAAGALTLGTLVSATAAQAATPRRAIADSHPQWAVAAKRLSSKAVTSGTVSARVYLAPSHQAELAGDVAAVSSPASQSYRHFWTDCRGAQGVRAVRRRGRLREVLAHLGRAGRDQDRREVPGGCLCRGARVPGCRQQGVRRDVRPYRGPDGTSNRAPNQAATAPSSVASSVLAVSGLDTAKSTIKPQLPPPPANYWVAKPCSTYYGQKPRPTSPRRTASTSPGPTAATRRARSAGRTG